MFFGLKEMSNSMQRGEERRSNQRKDNARLYNEFVKMNPGASTQERLDFANKLIKETGAGSAGLPTKSQMEGNVKKYKDQQAKKAAAEAQAKKDREQARAIRGLQNSKAIGEALAGTWGTPDFDAGLKAQFEATGTDLALLPNARKQAESTAWVSWMNNNKGLIDAYVQSPSEAALEALTAAGGNIWQQKITGSYNPVLERYLSKQRMSANTDIEALRNMTDKDAQEAQIKLIKQKYPDIADDLNFYEVRVALKAANEEKKQETIRTVEAEMLDIARTATDKADYETRVGVLLRKYKDQGVENFDGGNAAAEATLDKRLAAEKADQARQDQNNISIAVDGADALIEEGVKKGQNADDIEALIEQQFRDSNDGRTVSISDKDRARLVSAMKDVAYTLNAQIETAMDARLSGEGAAEALQSSKSEFMKAFVRELEAKGITNTQDYVNELGESYWAAAETKVRNSLDQKEAAKIADATIAMGDGSIASGVLRGATYDPEKTREVAQSALKIIPATLGVEDEDVAISMIKLQEQALTELQNIAVGLNIPVDQGLADAFIRSLGSIAQAAGTEEAYLNEDGTLPVDMMRSAFLSAFQANGFTGEYAELEAEAFNVALDAMGLASVEELMFVGRDQMIEFQSEYRNARADARTANFDIIRGVTVEEDTQPSTNIIENVSLLSDRVSTTIQNSSTLLSIAPEELVRISQGGGPGGAGRDAANFEQRIAALGNLEQELVATQARITSEARRLTSLRKSPIYTANHEGELDTINDVGTRINESLAAVKAQLESVRASQRQIDARYQQGQAILEKQAQDALEETASLNTPPLTSAQIAAQSAVTQADEQAAAAAAQREADELAARQAALQEGQDVATAASSQVQAINSATGGFDAVLDNLLSDPTLNLMIPRGDEELRFFKEDLIGLMEESGRTMTADAINGIVEAARRRMGR
jgi:predicted nuclease of restriction endonuclease-like (RecB) superfamily